MRGGSSSDSGRRAWLLGQSLAPEGRATLLALAPGRRKKGGAAGKKNICNSPERCWSHCRPSVQGCKEVLSFSGVAPRLLRPPWCARDAGH
jgi:hypothetical protein